jgi:alkylated DNA repair dioxygenase AlkB
VEGFKAAAVLCRLLPETAEYWVDLLGSWEQQAAIISKHLQCHHLSGLKWAYDCFGLHINGYSFPPEFWERYRHFDIPFRIIPACLQDIPGLSVANLVDQVDFQVEDIRTTYSNQVVRERRQTAWQGEHPGVAPFEYSGKSMDTQPWSPTVRTVRDRLQERTGQYYDGCLLNLYPDGGSGMRYHIDPEQGVLWDYETAVVSVGATRRFAFRDIPLDDDQWTKNQPHTFVVMQGDVTEMFDDCQFRFQHTVKNAEDKNEEASRCSLVFKRTLTKRQETEK